MQVLAGDLNRIRNHGSSSIYVLTPIVYVSSRWQNLTEYAKKRGKNHKIQLPVNREGHIVISVTVWSYLTENGATYEAAIPFQIDSPGSNAETRR
jgi:hypothetical protein